MIKSRSNWDWRTTHSNEIWIGGGIPLVPPISIAHESLASFRIPTQRPAPLILRQGFYCPWRSSPWAHFRAYPSNLACPLLPIARREANPFSSYCHACCLWLLTARSLHRSRNLLSWYPGKYWHVVARGASSKLFQTERSVELTKVLAARECEFLWEGGARSTCYPAPGRFCAGRGFRIDIAQPHVKLLNTTELRRESSSSCHAWINRDGVWKSLTLYLLCERLFMFKQLIILYITLRWALRL